MANPITPATPKRRRVLWSWAQLRQALGAKTVAPAASGDTPDIQGLAFDSRLAEPGDLFIALPGDPGPAYNASQTSARDGHNYVDAAVANGAVAAMTHDAKSRAVAQLAVTDTLDGLRALAQHRREQSRAIRVAITGSSGKTTAKTLLASAFATLQSNTASVHASEGSFNNHLGVPLSLATMPLDAEFAVFEIGTNHPGEIGPLSQLVQPNVAVLLNVHAAHIGNFPSRHALTLEKLSITDGLVAGGVLVIEDAVDIPAPLLLDLKQRSITIYRFGTTSPADVQLLNQPGDEGAKRAHYRVGEEQVQALVPGGGQHRALTLAAVLGVLRGLALPISGACELMNDLVPQGRGNLRQAAGIALLDDSYNANPQSMSAALLNLAQQTGVTGRRLALLGDMLELGDQSQAEHEALAGVVAALDGVWLVGPEMAALANRLPKDKCLAHVTDLPDDAAVEALLKRLTAQLQPGDMLLVKASKRIFWAHEFVDRLVQAISQQGA